MYTLKLWNGQKDPKYADGMEALKMAQGYLTQFKKEATDKIIYLKTWKDELGNPMHTLALADESGHLLGPTITIQSPKGDNGLDQLKEL